MICFLGFAALAKDEYVVYVSCILCDFVVLLSPFREMDFRAGLLWLAEDHFCVTIYFYSISLVNFFKIFVSKCCSFLAGSPFFRDDTRLRALRFLDHMLVCILFSIILNIFGEQ